MKVSKSLPMPMTEDPFSALDLLLAASEIVEEKEKAKKLLGEDASLKEPSPKKKKLKTSKFDDEFKAPILLSSDSTSTLVLPKSISSLPPIKKKVEVLKEKIPPWRRPFFQERPSEQKQEVNFKKMAV